MHRRFLLAALACAFATPTLHCSSEEWWATLTWLPQARGGGEAAYDGQDPHLQLVEKIEDEARLKLGFNV